MAEIQTLAYRVYGSSEKPKVCTINLNKSEVELIIFSSKENDSDYGTVYMRIKTSEGKLIMFPVSEEVKVNISNIKTAG